MYIRQTKTRNSGSGQPYFRFRLVASERIGQKVRQRILLNLGRNFSLAKEQWPRLCSRIDQILSGQGSLLPESVEIEELAHHCAAQLVVQSKRPVSDEGVEAYEEVDVASLEMVRPRSVGVDHVGLAALSWLGVPRILESAGFNGYELAAAVGSIMGRMAAPGSELSTWQPSVPI